MRLLVVEDESKLLNIVERGLRSEGFAVDGVATVRLAEGFLRSVHYDLVILDLQLPDGSGVSVLRRIRERDRSVPVLVLTARGDIETKTESFQAGADDYLTKPFSVAELVLRVQALLRRGPVIQQSVLRIADLELNRITRQVRRGGKRIELSPTAYALLEYLSLHAGRTLSRSMIIEKVWDQSFEGLTNIVDVYVRSLRLKIDEGHALKLIRTVRGVGYRLEACEEE